MVLNTPFNWRLNWWQQALFLIVLITVLEVAGLAQPIVGSVGWLVTPVKRIWVTTLGGVYGLGDSLQKLPKAAQRIQDLELRLAEASTSLAELETVKQENEQLRAILTASTNLSDRTLISTPVIAFAQPAVAAGQEAGVNVGAVVLSNNILLGQIAQVGRYQSTVVLLFAKESQPLLATTDQGVSGLVVGDGKKVLFTEVPKEAKLQVGERLVTLGQPQVEAGLPIGKIVKVTNDPVLSVQSAVVEQYVSFFETPIVEIR